MAWIRSQDKKSIINSYSFRLQECHHMDTCQLLADLALSPTQEYSVTGTFPSKVAAMNELDRIHQWIREGGEGVFQVGEDAP